MLQSLIGIIVFISGLIMAVTKVDLGVTLMVIYIGMYLPAVPPVDPPPADSLAISIPDSTALIIEDVPPRP